MNTPTRPSSSAVTRRAFVTRFGAGLAGLSLALQARAQTAAADTKGGATPRKLGVALVGLGNYSRGQLGPALKLTQHCELKGVVTGSKEKGVQWAKDYGFSEKNIWNYDTMAQMADAKDIDIVYVVTPNTLHMPHAIAAVRAGKHLICEKPFTCTTAEADQVLAEIKKAKVKHSMGYRLHFDPFHKELKRIAREKDFGELKAMKGANGFKMGRKVWRAEKALAGGGSLMDMGVYCINEACLVQNEATPIAITAKEHPNTRPDFFTDVEEGLDWTMEFANGAKGEFSTSYNQNYGYFRGEGDKGWIEFKPAYSYGGLKVETSKGPLPIEGVRSQQALQMDDFAICVRDNRETIVPCEMGRRDMVIIDAIYESIRTGKRVTIKA